MSIARKRAKVERDARLLGKVQVATPFKRQRKKVGKQLKSKHDTNHITRTTTVTRIKSVVQKTFKAVEDNTSLDQLVTSKGRAISDVLKKLSHPQKKRRRVGVAAATDIVLQVGETNDPLRKAAFEKALPQILQVLFARMTDPEPEIREAVGYEFIPVVCDLALKGNISLRPYMQALGTRLRAMASDPVTPSLQLGIVDRLIETTPDSFDATWASAPAFLTGVKSGHPVGLGFDFSAAFLSPLGALMLTSVVNDVEINSSFIVDELSKHHADSVHDSLRGRLFEVILKTGMDRSRNKPALLQRPLQTITKLLIPHRGRLPEVWDREFKSVYEMASDSVMRGRKYLLASPDANRGRTTSLYERFAFNLPATTAASIVVRSEERSWFPTWDMTCDDTEYDAFAALHLRESDKKVRQFFDCFSLLRQYARQRAKEERSKESENLEFAERANRILIEGLVTIYLVAKSLRPRIGNEDPLPKLMSKFISYETRQRMNKSSAGGLLIKMLVNI